MGKWFHLYFKTSSLFRVYVRFSLVSRQFGRWWRRLAIECAQFGGGRLAGSTVHGPSGTAGVGTVWRHRRSIGWGVVWCRGGSGEVVAGAGAGAWQLLQIKEEWLLRRALDELGCCRGWRAGAGGQWRLGLRLGQRLCGSCKGTKALYQWVFCQQIW